MKQKEKERCNLLTNKVQSIIEIQKYQNVQENIIQCKVLFENKNNICSYKNGLEEGQIFMGQKQVGLNKGSYNKKRMEEQVDV